MKSHPAGGPTSAEPSGMIGGVNPRTVAAAFRDRRRRRGLLLDRPARRHVPEVRAGDHRARRADLRPDPRRRSSRLRAGDPGGLPGAALVAAHDGRWRWRAPCRPWRRRGSSASPRATASCPARSRSPRPDRRAYRGALATVADMPEPVLPSTARTLLARTARAQREGRAPSLVAGVVRDGGLAWSAGRGEVAEPHTDVQYRLGLDQQDDHRGRGDAAARRGPRCTSTTRSSGTCPAPRSATARSASCSPTWPAPSAESPGGWWERTPGGSLDGPGAGGRRTSSSARPGGSTTPTSASACSASWSPAPRGTLVGGRRHAPRCSRRWA